jgi:hypothetical protein
MRCNAFVKLVTASCVFSAVGLTSMMGRAQDPTPTANWVNIKSPAFGAYGDGKHDDTAAIQAAIDYAFNNNLSAVYCPAGTYKVSNTIWLDPPNNERAITWTGTGYISGTSLYISSTITGAFSGVQAYVTGTGVTAATVVTAGMSSPYTVNNSQTVGSSGSPIALSATTPSAAPQFSFTMSFFGDPSGEGASFIGCHIEPTFNNAIAFVIGPGQYLRVSDVALSGYNSGASTYRGNLPPSGVGFGVTCNSGGTHATLFEQTAADYFYAGYKTCALGNGSLSDANSWRKVEASNDYYGIYVSGTQAYIDDIIEPQLYGNTIAIENGYSKQIQVLGGILSSASVSNSFPISSVTVTPGSTCGSTNLCVQATLTNDGYIPNVYNAYAILTQHYGLIPFTLTSWKAGTGVINLQATNSWLYTNYGSNSYWDNNRIQTELAAATTLYAAEQTYMAHGPGVVLDGVHLENPGACAALFVGQSAWTGQTSSQIRNVFFNYDPTTTGTAGSAQYYCQLAFPFIADYGGGPIKLSGGNWSQTGAGQTASPYLLDLLPLSTLSGEQLSENGIYPRFNVRFGDPQAFGQVAQPSSGINYQQIATVARATGRWDADYFLPTATAGKYAAVAPVSAMGEAQSDYCGNEPCPWAVPNLSPTLFGLVCPGTISGGATQAAAITCSGSLGALGTYPPIPCRTVFKSVDWNTTAHTAPGNGAAGPLFRRSASCPGWSYGQNLTDSVVAPAAAVINGSISTSGSPITWNTSTAVNMSFSNNSLTATQSGAPYTYANAVATSACAGATKPYFQEVFNAAGNTVYDAFGAANSTWVITGQLGDTTKSWGIYGDGTIHVNGNTLTTLSRPGVGTVVQIAMDETASPTKVWIKVGTAAWNGVTGAVPGDANGISLTGLVSTGGLYPGVTTLEQNDSAAATFKNGTVPAGFTSCDPNLPTLTMNSVSSGTVAVGQLITGSGVSAGTYITGGSGTSWAVNNAQTVSSEVMSLYAPVTWNYDRGSSDLYLDVNTLSWMFPGLGISIDPGDGGGARPYTVTGVYPALGYVTVIYAGKASGNAGGNSVGLQGPNSQVYSCASACTIGQAPFAWTAY